MTKTGNGGAVACMTKAMVWAAALDEEECISRRPPPSRPGIVLAYLEQ